MAAVLQYPSGLAAASSGKQQASPLRPSSFCGSSVASCSYRPQLSLRCQSRRQSRLHAAVVYASVKAPWEGAPPARWGAWGE